MPIRSKQITLKGIDVVQRNPNLTEEQKAVLFQGATEPPFSGALLDEHGDGMFRCANCQSLLFDSNSKFDSGSGWPSFDTAIPGAINAREDTSHGMVRTEITCASCGAHLGHLFPDGPRDTTGLRYCVNSLALDFQPKINTK